MFQKICNGLHLVWAGLFLYLWVVKGRSYLNYDTLSASITMLEMTLVVGGLLSFGYFKYVAEHKAEDVAKKTAEEEAKLEARRATIEYIDQYNIDWDKLPRKEGGEHASQDFADALNSGQDEENAG